MMGRYPLFIQQFAMEHGTCMDDLLKLKMVISIAMLVYQGHIYILYKQDLYNGHIAKHDGIEVKLTGCDPLEIEALAILYTARL